LSRTAATAEADSRKFHAGNSVWGEVSLSP
jgi:hypothetical protein